MTTPRELFERLHTPDPPLILDVRNEKEFALWKIESPQMPETLNIPYFAFIEDEETSVAKVKSWIAGRSRDLVVVCAKGDSSEFVAEILKPYGIASQNLLAGWSNGDGMKSSDRSRLPLPCGSGRPTGLERGASPT